MSAEETIEGWGRTAPVRSRVLHARAADDVPLLLARAGERGTLPRGLGRAYGDAAQNDGGDVVDLTGASRVLGFDPVRGTIRVEAGLSLDALMRYSVPRGWFPAVTPGTRYVTVGGAIAADVHGKNHHRDGSFANHVDSLTLSSPRVTQDVTPTSDPELFWGTAGAMGLTGAVTEATLRLLPVETAMIRVDTERCTDLDDVMGRMIEGDHRYRHSVAWVDMFARGRRMGRAVLTRGDHARLEDLPAADRPRALEFAPRTLLGAPPRVPTWLLNRATVLAFDELYFRRAPRRRLGEIVGLTPFFHPLDAITGWNRLYGRAGFFQYQFVVPDDATAAVREIVERVSAERCAFLAVLKRFGPGNPGPLSFPRPGWTLAMDMPARADRPGFLDGLDRVVLDAGGRLYLAKDNRVPRETFRAMMPSTELEAFARLRDRVDPERVLRSDLSRRLGL
ncbi:FAD-binding oxidoreductase [bacterium]|nr:FAD-binding oxidoreductase [bacterium]